MALRREDWTTKKKQAMTIPSSRPATKSMTVMPTVMATMVMYSNAVTLCRVSQRACHPMESSQSLVKVGRDR